MGPERVFPSEDEGRDEERLPTATAWSEEEEEPNAAGGGAYHYQPLTQDPTGTQPMSNEDEEEGAEPAQDPTGNQPISNEDEEEEEGAEPEQTLQQRMEVMGLHLPEAPPSDPDEDCDWAEFQRSHVSIPMDADHVELVKRTMASLSFPSLGVPPWAQQISDDQWKDLVQTTLEKHKKTSD